MSTFLEAVKSGDAATVGRLLDSEPALVETSENGVSALMLALYHGRREVARVLADRGGLRTFPEACAAGSVERVQAMLRANPSLIDEPSPDGFPPLGLAIFFGNREVARLLIEEGADVNAAATNPQRVAPVHAAAAVRDHEILLLLLARGADPNARQESDYTPLHTAAARGDVAMATMLLERGADAGVAGSDGATVGDVARKYGHDAFIEWWEARSRR